MRVLLVAGLLGLATLSVYPILLAISLVADAILGDGSVNLNLFPSNLLRLSLSVILWDWVRSLPAAIGLIATLLTYFYSAQRYVDKANARLIITILGLLSVFLVSIYVCDSYLNGLIYLIYVIAVGMMASVIIRGTSRIIYDD